MSSSNQDEILSNFMSITGCSEDEARRYLEASNWDADVAMTIFFDNGGSEAGQPIAATNPVPAGPNPSRNPAENIASGGTGGYESDDESPFQSAIEESLRGTTGANPSASSVSKGDTSKKPAAPSKFGTLNTIAKDEEDSDEEGQAFYAGGSERSGQQIIGPPKPKTNEGKVAKIFEAARKQGAMEVDEDEDASSQRKKEQAFTGVGYTLGDESTPSRSYGQAAAAAAATSGRPEQVPLRFYSNGFTVGDGELRSFEENKEFMDHIKRGEVPPELRNLSAGGKQVEVRLEDHRGEEYRPTAPAFKAFGGVGHMLGSPTPNVVASRTTTDQSASKTSTTSSASSGATSTDTTHLEQLAQQQLKTSAASTTLRLRLPDVSTPVRIAIDLNRTVADLRKFLTENIPSLRSSQFEFLEPPSTKIKHEDETKTIGDAKLNNATLAVRRIS